MRGKPSPSGTAASSRPQHRLGREAAPAKGCWLVLQVQHRWAPAWPLSHRSARGTGQAAPRAAQPPELLSPEAQHEIPLSLKDAREAEAELGGQQRWLDLAYPCAGWSHPQPQRCCCTVPCSLVGCGCPAQPGTLTPYLCFSSPGRQQGGCLRLRHLLGWSGLCHHAGM